MRQSLLSYKTLLLGFWFFALFSPIIFSLTVLFVGCITPNYNHINHTISRLAIEKYGWIQELNFIQFAIGLVVTGFLMRRVMTDNQSKRLWLASTLFCAASLVVVSLFPTDPIENVRFSTNLLSPSGIVHFSTLALVLFLAPFGIRRLSRSLMKEKEFSFLAHLTSTIGYTVSILCFIWMAFYIEGVFLQYRGIFQKIIAIICMYWLVRVVLVIRRPLFK